jgi:hypothetical protein
MMSKSVVTDHYGTACRLGASPSAARLYERYMEITANEGIRPMSCKAFLATLDQGKPIRIIGRLRT